MRHTRRVAFALQLPISPEERLWWQAVRELPYRKTHSRDLSPTETRLLRVLAKHRGCYPFTIECRDAPTGEILLVLCASSSPTVEPAGRVLQLFLRQMRERLPNETILLPFTTTSGARPHEMHWDVLVITQEGIHREPVPHNPAGNEDTPAPTKETTTP